ncbi:MAG: hypothetical protein Q8L70_02310, partial [Methylotenera sp.]|nr:hypothetical protein [Methylotenera sp.]
LAKRYGKPRLEAGCTVALQIGTYKYSHVRDILKNRRDQTSQMQSGDFLSVPYPLYSASRSFFR